MAVEFVNHITLLQLRLGCRRSGHYVIDNNAFGVRAVLAWLEGARQDAKVTANDPALLQQALKGGPNRVRRNSEANSLRTAATRNDRRIDADYFPAQIDQRAAAIPGIDCRIGLEQIAERVRAIWSPLRTNDAVSHGFLKSEWITNGQNKVPSLYHVGIRQLERFDAGIIDLKHSQIDLRIRTHQARFLGPTIAQLHFNLIHLIDNVIIRDDMPFIRHNHT